MSGIILISILVVWFFIVKVLARLCVIKMQPSTKKTNTHIILFILIFIVPFADDIVGGFQFRAMCTPKNLLVYDPEKVRGRSVTPRDVPFQIINKIIPIHVSTGQWEDAETGELLITYKIFRAKGGWLSRLIGFPQGSPPYTFNGYCSSKEYYQLYEKYNVTKIEN